MSSCSFIPVRYIRTFKILFILILFPIVFQAQTLTGLWIGTISNDSTTIRKDQSFEIALTEYRGKVYGYSRSEFIVDDVLYYIVKRVKGTINGDVCEVTDDEIISYNFPRKPDRNVKVVSTFRRSGDGSAWSLDGKWKTTSTKKFYTVTGTVALNEEKDLTASKIFPHLEELKLSDDVAFYKERVQAAPIVKLVKPEPVFSGYSISVPTDLARTPNNTIDASKLQPNTVAAIKTPSSKITGDTASIDLPNGEIQMSSTNSIKPNNTNSAQSNADVVVKSPEKKRAEDLAQTKIENPLAAGGDGESVNDLSNNAVSNTAVNQKKQQTSTQKDNPAKKKESVASANTTKPQSVKDQTIIWKEKQATPLAKDSISENKTGNTEIATLPEVKADIRLKAAIVAGRKSEFTQEVLFKSDSLQVALYDNGEIDGDTVSVYMNGEVILAHQGLKSSAIRKTIYLKPGTDDEFTLVLFAENLGKYPPNTGLLVVKDGNDIYNLRFSSDYEKNAGIVFKRKK